MSEGRQQGIDSIRLWLRRTFVEESLEGRVDAGGACILDPDKRKIQILIDRWRECGHVM